MKKYKVLNNNRISPFRSFEYPIGTELHCEDFDEDVSEDCSRGFYATDIEGLPYSWNINRTAWECEVWGKSVVIDQYKQRYENIKLIRQLNRKEIISLAQAEESRLGYILSEVLFPVNPLEIEPKDIDYKSLLVKWDSVWDSVMDSVWASVWASVRDSVWVSVGASVRDSVRASVRDSVRDSVMVSVGASVWVSVMAYISSLFPNITKWKYIDHPENVNPFQSAIDLWRAGYVPSFDGKRWRLHTGKNAKVIYELSKAGEPTG